MWENATYAAAAYDDGSDGEMVSHTCAAHVKTYEVTGTGQNFILMNLKCMLHKRTQMKLGEDGELFFSDEFW
jgi:hypothetical protein